uniref:Uncharacterized protein n=1 Tax=Magallana gigas TaxID=29159 RepID=K1R9W8_MAGGI
MTQDASAEYPGLDNDINVLMSGDKEMNVLNALVQYCQDDCERDEDLYELTEQEFKSDLREGNLFIINNTDLDHCYGKP